MEQFSEIPSPTFACEYRHLVTQNERFHPHRDTEPPLLYILYLNSAILPVNLFTFFFAPQMAIPK